MISIIFKKFLPAIFLLIAAARCTSVLNPLLEEKPDQIIQTVNGTGTFSIIFSGNINGETHPCGCRNFPLGGLPQVAGALAKEKKLGPIIFLDTGDSFFPMAQIPKSVEKSHQEKAKALMEALSQLELNFWLPGDQDFAQGVSFLEQNLTNRNFSLILSNAKNQFPLKGKNYARILLPEGENERWIYLVGLLDPKLLPLELAKDFFSPEEALSSLLVDFKNLGYQANRDYLIVMSHQGMDQDRLLAQKFPQIDWIFGAHTQTFTNTAYQEGETKLVQVLAKNHYLGKVVFPIGKKAPGQFSLIEVRDELKDQLNPNPMVNFLDEHKAKMDSIFQEEQLALTSSHSLQVEGPQTLRTYVDCMGCHQKQTEFWSSTAHALSLTTLWKANESNNPQCIGCHVLGYGEKNGFNQPQNFTLHQDPKVQKNYLLQMKKAFSTPGTSLKKMSPQERKKLFKKWSQADEKYEVTHNFAGVQCLHCHNPAPNHPFNPESGIRSDRSPNLTEQIHSTCVKCHTPDRSPEWHQGEKLKNEKWIKEKMKKISCPK